MAYYKELYSLQDKFLSELYSQDSPFYLTGGTALSRFYLKHRWSDDLDFFVNNDSNFVNHILTIKQNVIAKFRHNSDSTLITEDFFRTFIFENNLRLKIEFVNDVSYFVGCVNYLGEFKIDNLKNILCNKLTAIIGRDEPKDIYDLIYLSINFDFNWKEVFQEAKEKAIINEIDVIERLSSFPIQLFNQVNWTNENFLKQDLHSILQTIIFDFTSGTANTLGFGKMKIEDAKPEFIH
jgi:predicted nucleotidyltransferase component of viral defense system